MTVTVGFSLTLPTKIKVYDLLLLGPTGFIFGQLKVTMPFL
jgi:hypothetical protein